MDCFFIVGREVHNAARTIKEAMFIWVSDPSLSGRLSRMQDTPALCCRWPIATISQWVNLPHDR